MFQNTNLSSIGTLNYIKTAKWEQGEVKYECNLETNRRGKRGHTRGGSRHTSKFSNTAENNLS